MNTRGGVDRALAAPDLTVCASVALEGSRSVVGSTTVHDQQGAISALVSDGQMVSLSLWWGSGYVWGPAGAIHGLLELVIRLLRLALSRG